MGTLIMTLIVQRRETSQLAKTLPRPSPKARQDFDIDLIFAPNVRIEEKESPQPRDTSPLKIVQDGESVRSAWSKLFSNRHSLKMSTLYLRASIECLDPLHTTDPQ
jgi:hypothetical protein